jgi:excisionase family DNA binding protein
MENAMEQEAREPIREGLSITEACAMAGIGRTRLYAAIAAGDLLARKFGKRRIILRSDLRQFLQSLPTHR